MPEDPNHELQTPGSREPLRRVVDSTVAIAFARFFMPVALTVIGYFMITTISDIKTEIRTANAAIWDAVKGVGSTLNTQSVDIAVLKSTGEATGKSVERLNTVTDKLIIKSKE